MATISDVPAAPLKTQERESDFHAHLDECEQCREHPLDLCSTGAELMWAIRSQYLLDTYGIVDGCVAGL